MRLFNFIAVGLIIFYRYSLSYFFGGQCRFYPSCSEYAMQCYQKFNFVESTYLVMKRLLKCHPFSNKNGFDPIPLNNESQNI